MAPNAEVPGSTPPTAAHGVEVGVELKPVEHPVEPLNNDQPVKCPLPEPSILNVSFHPFTFSSFIPLSFLNLVHDFLFHTCCAWFSSLLDDGGSAKEKQILTMQ